MKKILLSTIALTAFVFTSTAQVFVGTNPENKAVVLEEFTGKTCGWCPAGHKIADNMKAANPDKVVLINIHEGSFASGTPNYRTAFGPAFVSLAKVTGYPAGSVNRTRFDGITHQSTGSAMSRSTWNTAGGQILSQTSPANIAVRGNYDPSTNKLYVAVEVYFTSDVTDAIMVSVGVMQNNIMGPQSGGATHYPEKMVNGQYRHDHMLRHMITGQWGEQITTTSSGSFWSYIYEWDVPVHINDIEVKPEDLEVFAFIATEQQPILNGEMKAVTEIIASVEEKANEETKFSVYPNPTTEVLNISTNNALVNRVMVYNIHGQIVMNKQIANTNMFTLNVDELPAGIYSATLVTEKGNITEKFIKR
jgi:hypothetical protein